MTIMNDYRVIIGFLSDFASGLETGPELAKRTAQRLALNTGRFFYRVSDGRKRVSLLQDDQAALECCNDHLGAVPRLQLAQNVSNVELDCALSNEQCARNLMIAHAAHHQSHHFQLPLSQLVVAGTIGQLRPHFRRNRSLLGVDGSDGRQQHIETFAPCPGRLMMASCPPASSARSRMPMIPNRPALARRGSNPCPSSRTCSRTCCAPT